ncbi:MAG: sialate O-acetylesterase, partial [Lachnospiraceae bacterium]|nr:sialate O-acetylesterase [Lachnospiraceae bacterium]
VTVGIIGCNWGGTSASAWMDRETLSRDRELRSYIDDYEAAIAGKTEKEQIQEYREYEEYDAEWNRRAAVCYAEDPSMSWDEVQRRCGVNRWPGPMCCINPFRPAGLYECMLKRVMPYTLRGFLYYQGESDDHKPRMYDRLFSELIMKWRGDWGDFSLPFLMVQLPMHRYEADPDYRHWCLIREAQMKVFETVKNTGIAVILDCGEFNEIHPKDKVPVGERLALQAMWLVYGTRTGREAFGPIYRSAVIRGDRIELHFDHADGGFEIRGDGSGFEVAGEDGVYYPAAAVTDGLQQSSVQASDAQDMERENTQPGGVLWVSAPQVPAPRCARYCWTNYGPVNYFGKNGLPLAPFRTSREDAGNSEAEAHATEIHQVMEL